MVGLYFLEMVLAVSMHSVDGGRQEQEARRDSKKTLGWDKEAWRGPFCRPPTAAEWLSQALGSQCRHPGLGCTTRSSLGRPRSPRDSACLACAGRRASVGRAVTSNKPPLLS